VNLNYGIGVHVTILTLCGVAMFLRAFALATLWRWFAVPLGLPAIGWAHAYGFGLLVNLAAASAKAIKDRDIADAAAESRDATGAEKATYVSANALQLLFAPLLCLAVAYVVHSVMGAS
jgi:hypothetical protein